MNAPISDGPGFAEDATPEGPGHRLKRAREAANISVGEVSARLHLDLKTVRALEADNYIELPAPAFVRGYLRGYARMLNVPVEPLVESFDVHGLAPPKLVADISEGPQARSSDFSVQLFTYIIVIALGVLVFLWWRGQVFVTMPTVQSSAPSARESSGGDNTGLVISGVGRQTGASAGVTALGDDRTATTTEATTLEVDSTNVAEPTRKLAGDAATRLTAEAQQNSAITTVQTGPVQAIQSTEIQPSATLTAATSDSSTGDSNSTPVTTPDVAPAPEVNVDVAQTTATQGDSTSAAAIELTSSGTESTSSADGLDSLVMRFPSDSWVEVYDRNEAKLYWNLVKKGRELDLSGPGPLRVLLGKVRGVEVVFNGRSIDFAPHIYRGVARFVLGPDGIGPPPPKPGEAGTAGATGAGSTN